MSLEIKRYKFKVRCKVFITENSTSGMQQGVETHYPLEIEGDIDSGPSRAHVRDDMRESVRAWGGKYFGCSIEEYSICVDGEWSSWIKFM